MRELASAAERKNIADWKDAILKLDKSQGIIQEDLDAALVPIFQKDTAGAKAFLERYADECGAAPGYCDRYLAAIEEQPAPQGDKLKTMDKSTFYVYHRMGGIGYGPRFRTTDLSFKLTGPKPEVIATNRVQLDGCDAWEEKLGAFHPGLLDAGLHCQLSISIPD